jgi:succinate dehydrogenase/fumarate reductase cytochrome b subunit
MSSRLVRIQAASGLAFAVFASLHLVNTMLAALGAGAYNGFQRALRPVYQFPAVEIGLLAVPLVVHVGAGVARWRERRRRGSAAPRAGLRTRLHRASGLVLLVFVWGHVAATRGPSLLAGVHPEFEGLAFSVQWLWTFVPYYALFALAGLYHTANGTLVALAAFGVRAPAARLRGPRFWGPLGAGAALLLLGIAGIAGWLHPIGESWRGPYAEFVARIVGLDLDEIARP